VALPINFPDRRRRVLIATAEERVPASGSLPNMWRSIASDGAEGRDVPGAGRQPVPQALRSTTVPQQSGISMARSRIPF